MGGGNLNQTKTRATRADRIYMPTPWPTSHEYALARECPQCHAPDGEECKGRKRGTHLKRQDAGMRHRTRDVGRAPWPECRQPGKRYDTLQDDVETYVQYVDITALVK